jgi:quercetin dioxygenase-like cupin family protein
MAARAIAGRQALFAADRPLVHVPEKWIPVFRKGHAQTQNDELEPHCMSAIEDKKFALSGDKTCNWRAEEILRSAEFRKEYASRPNVVAAEDMPWERSPDGLIKHLINHRMNTPELCVEAYMLFLKDGERSGKHRHMWEELTFVVEGSGYDLHWDMKFDCQDKFLWEWADEPKKFEWKQGDYIYVPPFTNHQHFATKEARLIIMSNRMIKEMGFDWLDQLENAPGF